MGGGARVAERASASLRQTRSAPAPKNGASHFCRCKHGRSGDAGARSTGETLQTEIVAAEWATGRAVELLRAGEVVALPTETVYGLAADGRNPDAVAKIFEAKERPRFDPLIVHLPTRESLETVAHIESELVSSLITKFWPGPLTLVLRKREAVPDIVTAGLNTVAVRVSAHPVFQQIISTFDGPLAVPSANRFGRISPTSAQHVYEELATRIPLIVDGGPTVHGLESTIVRVSDETIEILRHGPVTVEVLGEFAPVRARTKDSDITAPGQLPVHYAPRTRLILVDDLSKFSPRAGQSVGALSFRPTGTEFTVTRFLSRRGDLREAAANLFRLLRQLDRANLDLIVAEKVPNEELGVAINDRLQRASAG